MLTERDTINSDDIEATHEFDARFFIDGRPSPLCGVRLWMPLDCHEDARIQVVASDQKPASSPPAGDSGMASRLVSQVDPGFGLSIEAEDLLVRTVNTKHGLRIHGTRITLGHIGRLKFRRVLVPRIEVKVDPTEICSAVSFHLSDLRYAGPVAFPTMDDLGNRSIKVSRVRVLEMSFENGPIKLELTRHWSWSHGKFNRLIAGSFPVLVVKDCRTLCSDQLDVIMGFGRDVCLLLTLAARHLTVVHVMNVATASHRLEEWISPLNRQRSTTEEEATGPLVDENDLETYFARSSVRWAALNEQQRDAVRLAVFSIHPFTKSSSEAGFLRMFTALEGLATTWAPGPRTLGEKVQALLTAFPPRIVAGLWPIVTSSKDGLYAIRNQLAHGSVMRGSKQEAVSVGTDHLRVWIERILLAILDVPHKESPHDWLSSHVCGQASELPRLRASIKT